MKKLTRVLSGALAASMLFALTACAPKAPAGSASTPAASKSTASGTGASTPAATGEIVNLKWAMVGNGMPANYDAWKENINAYLGEKIGVNIDVEVVPWADWDTRRNVIVNTSADFDILFTNLNTYVGDVRLGAFLDLSDMVETVTPDLYASVPENYWDAVRIDGKIYSVPTYKDSSATNYFVYDSELAASAGVDPSTIKTMADLGPALKAITEKGGKPAFPLYNTGAGWVSFEYDSMSTGLPTLGVRYDDASAKVVPVFEQPDVMETLTLMHEWYQNGSINADAATAGDPAGYKPVMIAQGWSAAAKTSWGPNMGVEAEAYQWKETIVSNDSVRGSLNCISSNCKNPEKALEFLELVNTDAKVRDAFYYGLEGDNFEYTADNKVHKNNSDWEMAGYTQGSFFVVTQQDTVDFNEWDEVKALNENAKASVLLGFTFDTAPIADQLANCIEIWMRYRSEVSNGVTDPVVSVPEMMKEMRAAGFDEIAAEAQTQVDAFLAAK